jgi:hypothetical protein
MLIKPSPVMLILGVNTSSKNHHRRRPTVRKPTQNLHWQAMQRKRRRSVQFSIFTQNPADETQGEATANDTQDSVAAPMTWRRSKLATRPLNGNPYAHRLTDSEDAV